MSNIKEASNRIQQVQRDLARQDLYESMQALVWGTELGDDLSETLKAACNQKLNVSPQRGRPNQ